MRPGRLVHVVDDDEGVRNSVIFLLKTAGFAVRGWPSGRALLEQLDPSVPACITLDLHMPRPDGFTVLRELSRRGHAVPVIVLTAGGGPTIEVLRAGAFALIEKPVERRVLLAAIERGFERIANPDHSSAEASSHAIQGLNDHEREVLAMLASGGTNASISARLSMDIGGVEVVRARILAKLGVSQLPGAIGIAFAAGLVDRTGDRG